MHIFIEYSKKYEFPRFMEFYNFSLSREFYGFSLKLETNSFWQVKKKLEEKILKSLEYYKNTSSNKLT